MSLPDTRAAEPSVLARGLPVVAMVVLMWAGELVDAVPGVDLDPYGIEPRSTDGLVGIVLAPFLHAGFGHLLANTTAFVVLGLLVAWTTPVLGRVTVTIVLLGGLFTWVVADPGTVHVGASGVVYGYAAYLVATGVLVRRPLPLAVGLVVVLMYGGIVAGALPGTPQVSWEGHLGGALAGVAAAVATAGRVRAGR